MGKKSKKAASDVPGLKRRSSLADFDVQEVGGTSTTLEKYTANKVALVINVASQCGFTPQYAGLTELHNKYKDDGFVVLGFPCNQFGGQEPAAAGEVCQFAKRKFDADFPIFEKIKVNGSQAHPMYEWLKAEQRGILGTKSVKWNFTKFLCDHEGQPTKRYSSLTTPEKIENDVIALLAARKAALDAASDGIPET